ncbi:hypothetical protein PAPYR_13382 [Paratrimastix pyriformis]|uniref:Uncharacterized protein n=1 Tax=Paratrimastix pyriformis TaxID=342808 RepID=A0ABQ8U0D0_9EUKA|nr:hypothetical protein PAPYR_13382 [Paratrimastix pyriformis]
MSTDDLRPPRLSSFHHESSRSQTPVHSLSAICGCHPRDHACAERTTAFLATGPLTRLGEAWQREEARRQFLPSPRDSVDPSIHGGRIPGAPALRGALTPRFAALPCPAAHPTQLTVSRPLPGRHDRLRAGAIAPTLPAASPPTSAPHRDFCMFLRNTSSCNRSACRHLIEVLDQPSLTGILWAYVEFLWGLGFPDLLTPPGVRPRKDPKIKFQLCRGQVRHSLREFSLKPLGPLQRELWEALIQGMGLLPPDGFAVPFLPRSLCDLSERSFLQGDAVRLISLAFRQVQKVRKMENPGEQALRAALSFFQAVNGDFRADVRLPKDRPGRQGLPEIFDLLRRQEGTAAAFFAWHMTTLSAPALVRVALHSLTFARYASYPTLWAEELVQIIRDLEPIMRHPHWDDGINTKISEIAGNCAPSQRGTTPSAQCSQLDAYTAGSLHPPAFPAAKRYYAAFNGLVETAAFLLECAQSAPWEPNLPRPIPPLSFPNWDDHANSVSAISFFGTHPSPGPPVLLSGQSAPDWGYLDGLCLELCHALIGHIDKPHILSQKIRNFASHAASPAPGPGPGPGPVPGPVPGPGPAPALPVPRGCGPYGLIIRPDEAVLVVLRGGKFSILGTFSMSSYLDHLFLACHFAWIVGLGSPQAAQRVTLGGSQPSIATQHTRQ